MNGFVSNFALVGKELIDHVPDFSCSVGVTNGNSRLLLLKLGMDEFGNGGLSGSIQTFKNNELAFLHVLSNTI